MSLPARFLARGATEGILSIECYLVREQRKAGA